METAERIFNLLKERGLEQKEFAKQIGVSPQKVSEWKKGKAKSFTKYMPKIAEALNTSVEYLLTGEELRKDPAPVTGPSAELLKNYDKLTPKKRAMVDRLIADLLESD